VHRGHGGGRGQLHEEGIGEEAQPPPSFVAPRLCVYVTYREETNQLGGDLRAYGIMRVKKRRRHASSDED